MVMVIVAISCSSHRPRDARGARGVRDGDLLPKPSPRWASIFSSIPKKSEVYPEIRSSVARMSAGQRLTYGHFVFFPDRHLI